MSMREPYEDSMFGAASLVSRLGLHLEPGENGPDLLTLTSPLRGEPEWIGRVRRYSGDVRGTAAHY